MPVLYEKDPQDIEDYVVGFGDYLRDGEVIATHLVTVPTDLTMQAHSHSNDEVSFRLTGGTQDKAHEVPIEVTTSSGRKAVRRIIISIKHLYAEES